MGGTHRTIQRQQIGQKSDIVDTTRMDKATGRPKIRCRVNFIRHQGPAWPIIGIETGVCGNSSGGSSLWSERNPGGMVNIMLLYLL